MPRFHFNMRRGDKIVADLDGGIFPDIETAREEATASARERLVDAIMSANEPPDCVQVCDSDGETVFTIMLTDMLPKSLRN